MGAKMQTYKRVTLGSSKRKLEWISIRELFGDRAPDPRFDMPAIHAVVQRELGATIDIVKVWEKV